MATVGNPSVGAPSPLAAQWHAIDWRAVNREVRRLQVRIAKAVRQRRYGKAKALQRLLTRSFSAKAWAVRRVVTNRGKRTPGVDGIVWKTPEEKMQAIGSIRGRGYRPLPLRRIYIPKKSGKRRPLSIPTMSDRAQQACHLLALNPVAETTADRHSYGFRLGRSIADALEQCFIVLARKGAPAAILEADIESCFDRFSHAWMLENIPMDASILRKWLQAGYLEKGAFHPTQEGTPQGGIISPVLANLALDGLQQAIRQAVPHSLPVHTVRFADDFVSIAHSSELLQQEVLSASADFLAVRTLRLSAHKTKIAHIDEGFDFLGAHLRKYKGKLLIKPSKDNLHSFLRGTREFICRNPAMKAPDLIRHLNRRIRGWANQNRRLVAKRTFQYADWCIFKSLWRWARRRHPKKNSQWVKEKYFRTQGNRNWIFSAPLRPEDGRTACLDLFRASSLPIRRHVKVRADANPFDPDFAAYFRQRRERQRRLRREEARRRRALNQSAAVAGPAGRAEKSTLLGA